MVNDLLSTFIKVIVNPAIILLFAVSMIVFVYGIINTWIKNEGPEARREGGNHLLWGLVGMTIMIGVFVIMSFIQNSLGISQNDRPTTIPSQ
jgi:hypothetical protein